MEFYVYCPPNKRFLHKDVASEDRTSIDFHTGEPVTRSEIIANTIRFTTNILEAGHANEMRICDICDNPIWKKLGLTVMPVAIDDEYTKTVGTLTKSCEKKDIIIDRFRIENKNGDLCDEWRHIREERDNLAKNIIAIEKENDDLKRANKSIKEEAKKWKDRCRNGSIPVSYVSNIALQHENNKLINYCKNKDVLIDDLTEEVKLLKNKLEKDAASIAKLVIENKSLRSIKNCTYGMYVGPVNLEQENETLKKINESIKKECKKWKTDCKNKANENAELKKSLDNVQSMRMAASLDKFEKEVAELYAE